MDRNFNKLRETISGLVYLSESSSDNDMHNTWNKAVSEIKNSDVLKSMYMVYEGVESSKFTNETEAELYLNECFMKFNAFTKSDVLNETKKLNDVLAEYIVESNERDNIFEIIMESTKDKKITKIIERMDAVKDLAKCMVIKESFDISETDSSGNGYANMEEVMKDFNAVNEKYSFLSEEERSIVEAFVTKNDTLKEELYNNLITENVRFIKKCIFEADENNHELIMTLSETENKLKSMEYNDGVVLNDFVKLMDLKK